MTNVTCRPIPDGAEGIGKWQSVFEAIGLVAVAMNVGQAVFVMQPMMGWPLQWQLGAFIVLEHAMLLLKCLINAAIPEEPDDVRRIEDFNERFRHQFKNNM